MQIYFLDDQKHRIDGFAICYPDGGGQYWLFGERFPSLPEFEHRLRKEAARERRAEIQRQNVLDSVAKAARRDI